MAGKSENGISEVGSREWAGGQRTCRPSHERETDRVDDRIDVRATEGRGRRHAESDLVLGGEGVAHNCVGLDAVDEDGQGT